MTGKNERTRCPVCEHVVSEDKFRFITLEREQERKAHARALRQKDAEIKILQKQVEQLLKQVDRLRPEPIGKHGYIPTYHRTVNEEPQSLAQKVIRKPITGEVRRVIYARDEHACVYCGATSEDERLHIDHVIPISRGGLNDMSNLVTACESCNTAKRDMLLEEWEQAVQRDGFKSLQDYLQQKMRKREKKHASQTRKAQIAQEARNEAIDEKTTRRKDC